MNGGRESPNGQRDRGSILGRVIPKTQKKVITTSGIQEKESRPPLHPGVVSIEKGAFGSLLTRESETDR